MATPPDPHLEQARANRAHAEYLVRERPTDPTAMQWAVTAAFYCALHCLEAHLSARGVRSRTHGERDAHIANPQHGVPSDVYAYYLQLKWWSEQARYQMRPFTAGMVEHTVLARYLEKVTRFVGLPGTTAGGGRSLR